MIIGKVIGSVVATRKNDKLVGNKFMVIEPIDKMNRNSQLVAIDNVGAGIGEHVLVTLGSGARTVCDATDTPVDAAIVGIIDDVNGIEI